MDEDCFSLRVVWNRTLIDDMLISLGIESNTTPGPGDQSALVITYSLTFSDPSQEEKWSVRRRPLTTPYSFPVDQLLSSHGQLLVSLTVETLLPNGSHLYLVSHSLANISSPSGCTGNPPVHSIHNLVNV